MLPLSSPPTFHPHPWVRGGDLQTLIGAVLPKAAPLLTEQDGFHRRCIPMRCGAQLDGLYRAGPARPAVLLLHGLGGTTRSGYVRETAARVAALGHPVLALDHRGSGEHHEESTRPYMAGNTDDVEDALAWLRKRSGTSRVFAVGFSISGNTLLRLLGRGTNQAPELALAVCPPIDLDAASHDLRRPRSKPYDLWVLRSCRRWIPVLTGDAAAGTYRVPPWTGLRVFDERYITPVWGFDSLSQYYGDASAAHSLHRVASPAVILHSSDDPIVSPRALASMDRSPFVQVEIVPGGGHLGFLARRPRSLRIHRWLPDAVNHYLTLCRDRAPTLCARP